jgi:DNA polymerase
MVVTSARQSGIPLEGLFDERTAEVTVNTYRSLFHRIPALWWRLDDLLRVLMSDNRAHTVPLGPVTVMAKRIQLPNGLFLRYDNIPAANLWGGKLLENIAQALARIVVMQAAVRLARQGLRFVSQSHDELIFVLPDSQVEESKLVILEEMIRPPPWLPDLPLAAEIGVGLTYGSCK